MGPGAMGIEIERKFLVSHDGWRNLAARVRRIRQGYLASGEKAGVRVRCVDGKEGSLTVKTAVAGAVRGEFEFPIPFEEAEALLGLCEGVVIEKLRHDVPFGGVNWEIDVFKGANEGLVVAEVELESEDQVFIRPDWLGEEVTADRRYYNASLARRPFRDWPGKSQDCG
jgi:adenylate cyclase